MLKLQELKRSLFGPNPEEIIRFCVVATFVQRLKRQYLFIKWPWNVFRLYLSCLTVVLVEIAPVVVYLRERTGQRVWRQNSSFSSYHMNLSPFTKDFRGGDLLRVICIFGDSAQAELHWNFKSRVNLTVYQHAVEGNAAGQLSLLSAFAVPVSRLHIYLTSVERQSFFICDGIQTLDMISLGLGPNKDRFSSWRPISDWCALSLSIFTDCASPHPPNALVVLWRA